MFTLFAEGEVIVSVCCRSLIVVNSKVSKAAKMKSLNEKDHISLIKTCIISLALSKLFSCVNQVFVIYLYCQTINSIDM